MSVVQLPESAYYRCGACEAVDRVVIAGERAVTVLTCSKSLTIENTVPLGEGCSPVSCCLVGDLTVVLCTNGDVKLGRQGGEGTQASKRQRQSQSKQQQHPTLRTVASVPGASHIVNVDGTSCIVAVGRQCGVVLLSDLADAIPVVQRVVSLEDEPSFVLVLQPAGVDLPTSDQHSDLVDSMFMSLLFGLDRSLSGDPVLVVGCKSGKVWCCTLSARASATRLELFESFGESVAAMGLCRSEASGSGSSSTRRVHDKLVIVGERGKVHVFGVRHGSGPDAALFPAMHITSNTLRVPINSAMTACCVTNDGHVACVADNELLFASTQRESFGLPLWAAFDGAGVLQVLSVTACNIPRRALALVAVSSGDVACVMEGGGCQVINPLTATSTSVPRVDGWNTVRALVKEIEAMSAQQTELQRQSDALDDRLRSLNIATGLFGSLRRTPRAGALPPLSCDVVVVHQPQCVDGERTRLRMRVCNNTRFAIGPGWSLLVAVDDRDRADDVSGSGGHVRQIYTIELVTPLLPGTAVIFEVGIPVPDSYCATVSLSLMYTWFDDNRQPSTDNGGADAGVCVEVMRRSFGLLDFVLPTHVMSCLPRRSSGNASLNGILSRAKESNITSVKRTTSLSHTLAVAIRALFTPSSAADVLWRLLEGHPTLHGLLRGAKTDSVSLTTVDGSGDIVLRVTPQGDAFEVSIQSTRLSLAAAARAAVCQTVIDDGHMFSPVDVPKETSEEGRDEHTYQMEELRARLWAAQGQLKPLTAVRNASATAALSDSKRTADSAGSSTAFELSATQPLKGFATVLDSVEHELRGVYMRLRERHN